MTTRQQRRDATRRAKKAAQQAVAAYKREPTHENQVRAIALTKTVELMRSQGGT